MAALKTIDESIRGQSIRNMSAIRRAIATVTQKRAAELLGIAPPTLSDWNEEHLERACQVLAALGLKLVPKGSQTLEPDEIAAFITLAKRRVNDISDSMAAAPASGYGDLDDR